MSSTTPGARLRELLRTRSPVVAPGAMNALFAKLIQRAGFDAIYVTGSGVATGMLGVPDFGLPTLTEVTKVISDMAEAVDVPLIADGDTGFGGTLNVERAVREYERAGAAAIQLEDQVLPKRCGHFDGKQVVPAPEMVVRIRTALQARRDPSFVIIARTDCRSILGFDEALRRGHLYADAGADVLFIESPESGEELSLIGAELKEVPLLANMVEGGKTPLHSATELAAMGFKIVIFPGLLTRVVTSSAIQALESLKQTGDSRSLLGDMVSFAELQTILGLEEMVARVEKLEAVVAPPSNAMV